MMLGRAALEAAAVAALTAWMMVAADRAHRPRSPVEGFGFGPSGEIVESRGDCAVGADDVQPRFRWSLLRKTQSAAALLMAWLSKFCRIQIDECTESCPSQEWRTAN